MRQLIQKLAEHPGLGIVLSVVTFFISYFWNYLLLDSLLKMHRSKSAVKKLKKEFTCLQRLRLLHFKGNCRHAIRFCDFLIRYQKIGLYCCALYLGVSLLYIVGLIPTASIAWLTVGVFLGFDLPAFALQLLFTRPVLGRFREYSFEKYHNTNDHQSLL